MVEEMLALVKLSLDLADEIYNGLCYHKNDSYRLRATKCSIEHQKQILFQIKNKLLGCSTESGLLEFMDNEL